MDYSLAKKLKDAGFPITWHIRTESLLPYPTLSELIEACGKEFLSLVNNDRDDNCWGAEDTDGNRYYGSTPEEAVANLWLRLKNIL